jgi:hypothetical protein
VSEANVADKRCDNGHFIDESWDLCPYCPVEQAEEPIPIVRPSRFGNDARPATGVAGGAAAAAAPRIVPAAPPRADSAVSFPGTQERTIAVPKGDPNSQPKRYVVGWLVGLSGGVRGESFPLRIGRNIVGRDRRSDIVINDDQASSHHADLVFRPEERRFILMDHNSTNGTYVNESEIEPRRDLSPKDIVRIGSHRFLFMPLCNDNFYWDEEGVLQ